MSAAYRKALPRREHRERAQPSARARLGILEKRKDYKLRASDYHAKQRALKVLREKAAFRNPDEFYHAMVRARVDRRGRHVADAIPAPTPDQRALVADRDAAYVAYKAQLEAQKIRKLEQSLLILKPQLLTSTAAARDADGDDADGDDAGGTDDDAGVNPKGDLQKSIAVPRPKHIVFTDAEESDADEGNAEEHRGTKQEEEETARVIAGVEEMIERYKTRRRTSPDEAERDDNVRELEVWMRKCEKAKRNRSKELRLRSERKDKLTKLFWGMEMQKNLMTNERKIKVQDADEDSGTPAVFRWKKQRKR